MKKIIKYLSVITFSGLLIAGCSELKKDIPTQAVSGSIVHGEGFANPSSPNFHGLFFKKTNTKMTQCRDCHGLTFNGGGTGVACTKCHPAITVHTDSLTVPGTANFHGAYVRSHNWNLPECQTCHGTTYSGGLASPSCDNQGCHSAANNGPEGCNTCHGNFADPNMQAPPRSTSGATETSNPGVGAHSNHLYSPVLGKAVACAECHNVPGSVFAPGHLDTQLPAELNFNGPLGNKGTTPSFDSGSLTCANTYCHGNFSISKASAPAADQYVFTGDQITGENFSPVWTKVDGSQKACGSCHALPPKGHIGYGNPPSLPITSCGNSGCHDGVVDANGNILDKTKHINGVVNVRGN